MSRADEIFVAMCRDILENGVSTEGEKVRPKWEDGTSAYTIKKFGVVNRYDLAKEFPALTLRRTARRHGRSYSSAPALPGCIASGRRWMRLHRPMTSTGRQQMRLPHWKK